jgi:Porin PorA
MRRVVGAVVLALGTFMVVAAVLLPTYVASNLVTTPLNQYTVSVATSDNATVFDVDTLTVQQNVPVEATRTVRADVEASTNKVVVFDEFLVVENTTNDKQITYSSDRVGIDRRSGETVKGFDAAVDDEPTPHTGLEYKWPFGAEKKSYQYFDTTTKKDYTARYVSTENINGLETYKYTMDIPATRIGELDVPGNLVGSTAPDVKAPRYYKNTRTVWVEPKTGIILKGQENQSQTLRDDAGTDRLTLFAATLTFDQQTIDESVSLAKDSINKINLVSTVAPLVVGILGVILIIVGLFLALRRGGTDESSYRPTKPSDTKTPVTS